MNGLNGGSIHSIGDECTSWLELESDPGKSYYTYLLYNILMFNQYDFHLKDYLLY